MPVPLSFLVLWYIYICICMVSGLGIKLFFYFSLSSSNFILFYQLFLFSFSLFICLCLFHELRTYFENVYFLFYVITTHVWERWKNWMEFQCTEKSNQYTKYFFSFFKRHLSHKIGGKDFYFVTTTKIFNCWLLIDAA